MHELLVSVYLMKHGYHVFRAMSPSCPCDIVAFTDNGLYRIEVTTGSGEMRHPPKKKDHYRYDYMAVVFHEGDIKWYDVHGDQNDGPP